MADKARRLSALPIGFLLFAMASPARAVTNCAIAEGTKNPALNCPRSAHTATLLPNGNILVAGGVAVGGVTDSYELDLEQKGLYVLWGTANKMVVARASHTATMLPNGKVLVTGGIDNAGTVLKSAELYDPLANTWAATAGGGDLAIVRYNHTATLLKNGLVLICGGQTDTGATETADCRFYNPGPGAVASPVAVAADGFAAAPPLLTARALHSAVLLSDGRVLFSGGFNNSFNPAYPTTPLPSPYLANQEIYDPGANSFAGAHGLIQGRAYHSATAMGNGSVLLVGGYNGNRENQSFGILESGEIYDPLSDSVAPTPPICNNNDIGACVRVQAAGAALRPDGAVAILDGIGNATTGFFKPAPIFTTGSLLQGDRCGPPVAVTPNGLSLTNVKGDLSVRCGAALASNLRVPLDFHMTSPAGTNIPVSGIIQNGTVFLSSPSATFSGGVVFFGSTNPLTGMQVNLAGVQVGCDTAGCGRISSTTFLLSSVGGVVGYFPRNINTTQYTIAAGASGCVDFTPTPLSASSATGSPIDVTAPNCGGANVISGPTTIKGLPSNTIGGVISAGSLVMNSGTISVNTTTPDPGINSPITFTITITNANLTLATNSLPIVVDPLNSSLAQASIPNAIWTGITGNVVTTSTNPARTPLKAGSGVVLQETGCGGGNCTTPAITMNVSALVGVLSYVPSQVDLSNVTLAVDVATAVIRSMVMDNGEAYNPSTNQWSFYPQFACTSCTPGTIADYSARYGGTATLLPNNDIRMIGGLSCNSPNAYGNCSAIVPEGSDPSEALFVPNTSVETWLLFYPAWTTTNNPPNAKRANHTATPLPDGRLLIAGGSNGPSSLQSAEVFDPRTGFFSPTGSMASPHDLHTATLLPNGRVLVAGGFTSNSNSSGSTTMAEIYYANPGIWIPTSPMNAPREQHTATLLPDGNVLVAGGFNRINGYLNSAEIYVSTIGSWQSLGNVMPIPLGRHSATLLQDGEVLFVGGINNTGIKGTVSAYNPTATAGLCAAGAWCNLAADPLKGAAVTYLHTATLLPGGSVLVAGGSNGLGEIQLAQIFDISQAAGARWSTQIPMSAGRANHTATLLPNGLVLVSGGATHNSQSLNVVETFDVGSGSWTSHGLMAANRAYHTTSLLADGTLLSVGGINGQTYLATSERMPFAFNDNQTVGAPPSIRQSSITVIDATNPLIGAGAFNYGSTVTLTGNNFMGFTEANGGSGGAGQSGFSTPRLLLQALDGSGGSSSQGNGGFMVDLTTRIYNSIPRIIGTNQVNTWSKITGNNLAFSSMTIKMPDCAPGEPCEKTLMPTGWYQLRMANSAVFSGGAFIQVGPPRISSSVAPLTFVAVSSAVTFNWASAGPVDGYNVYSTSAAVWLSSLSANTLFYTQGGLTANSTASITVAPFTIMGDGPSLVAPQALTLSTNPASVTISSVASTSVLLSWDSHGNGAGTQYEVTYVSESINPDGTWPSDGGAQFPFAQTISTPTNQSTLSFTPPLTTTFFQVRSLVSNTTYFFRVRAFNSAGAPSTYSNIASTTTRTPVSGITGFPCPSSGTTCIHWTWPSIPNVSPIFFKVRTTTGGALGTNITGTAPFFDDTGLLPNTTRQILVSAVTAPGEGDLVTSPTGYTLAAPPVFSADGNHYSVTDISTGSLVPQWDRGVNPSVGTSYSVFFASNAGLPFLTNPVLDNGSSPMQYHLGGLVPGEIYFTSITAVNQAPALQPSTGPLILGSFSPLPEVPNAVVVVGTTPNSITIQWDTGGNASTVTYAVYYSSMFVVSGSSPIPSCVSISSNPFFSTSTFYTNPNAFTDGTKTALRQTVGGLLTNVSYTFAVCSRNAFGQIFKGDSRGNTPPTVAGLTTSGGAVVGAFAQLIANPNVDNDISGTVGIGVTRALTLHVPGGAFPSPVNITFSSFTNTTPLCAGTTNIGISIVTDPSFQPVKPLTLSLAFTPAELAGFNASQVSLMRYDPATQKCIPFITSVDSAGGVINAQINHFTVFLVGAVTPSNTVDTARAFPNPFFTATDGFMTFENVPPFTRIRIWTMQGEAVYDRQANGSGLLTWPGINKSGRFVASGTYFVTFEAVGSTQPRKILKVVVLR